MPHRSIGTSQSGRIKNYTVHDVKNGHQKQGKQCLASLYEPCFGAQSPRAPVLGNSFAISCLPRSVMKLQVVMSSLAATYERRTPATPSSMRRAPCTVRASQIVGLSPYPPRRPRGITWAERDTNLARDVIEVQEVPEGRYLASSAVTAMQRTSALRQPVLCANLCIAPSCALRQAVPCANLFIAPSCALRQLNASSVGSV